jgi:NADPH:quinone reductase-like Zn-dependent oxidoreductase
VVPKPASLSFEGAAAVPMAGETAEGHELASPVAAPPPDAGDHVVPRAGAVSAHHEGVGEGR